jgi:hypothetical protein
MGDKIRGARWEKVGREMHDSWINALQMYSFKRLSFSLCTRSIPKGRGWSPHWSLAAMASPYEVTPFWPCTLHHPAPRSRRHIHGRHIEAWWLAPNNSSPSLEEGKSFRHTPSRVTISLLFYYYCYYLLKRIYTLFILIFLFRVLNDFVCIFLFFFSLLLILSWNDLSIMHSLNSRADTCLMEGARGAGFAMRDDNSIELEQAAQAEAL